MPKAKGTKFHGILAIGRNVAEASNRYRLAAMGKGAVAKVDAGRQIGFITTASDGMPQLFNPFTGEMDLRTSKKLLAKAAFEATASDTQTVKANHYHCAAMCGSHVVYDSDKLLNFCPVCSTAVTAASTEDVEEEHDALIAQHDAEDDEDQDDLEDESDIDALGEDDDEDDEDSEDEDEDDEDEESESSDDGDDEEDEDSEDEDDEDEDSEDDEEDEDDDTAEASAARPTVRPLVIVSSTQERAIELFRNERASQTSLSATTVQYMVCSSSDCGGHVISDQKVGECPACKSSLIEPEPQTVTAGASGILRVLGQTATASDDDEDEDDMSINDEDEEDEEDEEDGEDDESEDDTSESSDDGDDEEDDEDDESEDEEDDEEDEDDSAEASSGSGPRVRPGKATASAETPVEKPNEGAAAPAADVKPDAVADGAPGTNGPSGPSGVEGQTAVATDAQTAPVPVAPIAQQPITIEGESVNVDMLKQLDDSVPEAHRSLDVSYSSSVGGKALWTAYFQGRPVATAIAADAGQNASIFDEASFGQAVIAGAKVLGVKTILQEMGFKPVVCSTVIPNHVKDQVTQQVAEARAALEADQKVYAERLQAALATAAIGINRGFFTGLTNPVKSKLWDAMANAGIKSPESLLDAAFKASADDYHRTLFAKAHEIMSNPLEVQESLSKAVLGTAYLGVSQSSASAAADSALEDRLANFGTVTASSSEASTQAPAPAQQVATAASLDQRMSSVVSSLGRRR